MHPPGSWERVCGAPISRVIDRVTVQGAGPLGGAGADRGAAAAGGGRRGAPSATPAASGARGRRLRRRRASRRLKDYKRAIASMRWICLWVWYPVGGQAPAVGAVETDLLSELVPGPPSDAPARNRSSTAVSGHAPNRSAKHESQPRRPAKHAVPPIVG